MTYSKSEMQTTGSSAAAGRDMVLHADLDSEFYHTPAFIRHIVLNATSDDLS